MNEMSTLPPTRAMIGKWSVDRYVGLLRRWLLVSAVIVLAMSVMGWARTWTIIVELVVTILIGAFVARRGGGKFETLIAGAMTGLTLGLAASLGRYIHHPVLSTGLNIIVETMLTAVLATCIAVSAGIMTLITKQQKN